MSPRSLVALAVLVVVGCGTPDAAAATPECRALVERIRTCDPSATSAPTAVLEAACSSAPRGCATMDVSSADGCRAFMGCLYDD